MATATSSSAGAGRQVGLHPLAIVGVSDHFTRVKMGGGRVASRPEGVCGLLFGKQDGLDVVIVDAIELALGDGGRVNHEFLKSSAALYTDVYGDRELLGWYAVAREATPEHLERHREFVAYNDAPLLLLMDPEPSAADAKDLPIAVYESATVVVDGAPSTALVPLPWALVTVQAERIAMERAALAGPSAGESALDCHVDAVELSLNTLAKRVTVIVGHLRDVAAGKAEPDYALLRSIRALADRLPTGATPEIDADFFADYTEGLMIAYLASVTKNAAKVHDLSDKFALVNARGAGKLI